MTQHRCLSEDLAYAILDNMRTIDDIIERNKRAGHHFFDGITMAFFDSKVHPQVFGDYFVTSENPHLPSSVRKYTVRRVNWDNGAVDTVGAFMAHSTLRGAYQHAEKLSVAEMVK